MERLGQRVSWNKKRSGAGNAGGRPCCCFLPSLCSPCVCACVGGGEVVRLGAWQSKHAGLDQVFHAWRAARQRHQDHSAASPCWLASNSSLSITTTTSLPLTTLHSTQPAHHFQVSSSHWGEAWAVARRANARPRRKRMKNSRKPTSHNAAAHHHPPPPPPPHARASHPSPPSPPLQTVPSLFVT